MTVTPGVLTVTAADATRAYGLPDPAFSAVFSGFKNGETLATSGVIGSPALTTSATIASHPGSYAIVADLGNLAASNYAFRFANGTLTVATAATTTTLESSSDTTGYGQNVTFVAHVFAGSGGLAPTGTVRFLDGSTVIGTAVLSGSQATLTTYALGLGTHQIVAAYGGEGAFLSSQSSAIGHTVSAAASVSILSISSIQTRKRSGIVLDATVPPAYPGGAAPTGSILFTVNGRLLHKVALVNGRAQWFVAKRSSLNKTFTAFYQSNNLSYKNIQSNAVHVTLRLLSKSGPAHPSAKPAALRAPGSVHPALALRHR